MLLEPAVEYVLTKMSYWFDEVDIITEKPENLTDATLKNEDDFKIIIVA